MFTKVKSGARLVLSFLFLADCALFALANGILFAYMSNHGCSTVFIALSALSFFYFVLNLVLLFSGKVWERTPQQLVFITLLGILAISLMGLAYSVRQSVCDINVCGEGFRENNDDFYDWFNKNDRKDTFEDQSCGAANHDIARDVLGLMRLYDSENQPNSSFFISRGVPIAFTAIQSFLCLIHLILTFRNLYTFKGCRLVKTQGKVYF